MWRWVEGLVGGTWSGIETIPRIVHQTWARPELPDALRPLAESWRAHHPLWDYRFWTDRDLQNLVREEGPEIHDLYVSLPHAIQRVDLARYVILYRFGGLYVDLDLECLRPVDGLLPARRGILGQEPPGPGPGQGLVSNALMAFAPGDPFVRTLIDAIGPALSRSDTADPRRCVQETTGSGLLTRVLSGLPHRERRGIRVYDHRHFHPLTAEEAERLRRYPQDRGLLGKLHRAYAVHFFEGTWWKEPHPEAESSAIAPLSSREDRPTAVTGRGSG